MMKRRCCPKCKELQVIYSRPNNNKYNRSFKPFKCNACNETFTYKQVGAVKCRPCGYVVKNPEKVERIKKLLFKHCSEIMSENRRLIKKEKT